MQEKQAYNKRINAWVKFDADAKGFRPLDVKQKEPGKPFKGVPKAR